MIAKLPKPLPLFHELKNLIDSARQRAAVAVNAELTLLYWQVGQRINAEVLKGRGPYMARSCCRCWPSS